MKKFLLAGNLLIFAVATFASCDNSNVNWKMHITNKTPNTISLSCGNDIPSGATGIGSGLSYGNCGRAVSTSECTYTDAFRHTGTLILTYNSCNNYNLQASASANSSNPYPKPFSCPQAPNTKLQGSQRNTICPVSAHNVPSYYSVYSANAYFTISQSPEDVLTWKNIFMSLTKGQTVANKLASNLMQTGNYVKVVGTYSANAITLTLSSTPEDPYANMTTCEYT